MQLYQVSRPNRQKSAQIPLEFIYAQALLKPEIHQLGKTIWSQE